MKIAAIIFIVFAFSTNSIAQIQKIRNNRYLIDNQIVNTSDLTHILKRNELTKTYIEEYIVLKRRPGLIKLMSVVLAGTGGYLVYEELKLSRNDREYDKHNVMIGGLLMGISIPFGIDGAKKNKKAKLKIIEAIQAYNQ